jgi:hypothetical protein
MIDLAQASDVIGSDIAQTLQRCALPATIELFVECSAVLRKNMTWTDGEANQSDEATRGAGEPGSAQNNERTTMTREEQ